MANRYWSPSAKPVADVWTLTPGGTIETGDIFIVTIGRKSVSVSATGTTVAIVCDDIVAALNALSSTDYPEFAEYTFADATTAVTATAVTTGIPGTISVSTTESNGGAADAQTFVATHTTTGTGPNNWDNAGNWIDETGASAAVPADTDDVVIEGDVGIYYGLDAATTDLTSLTIPSTFLGTIGLPRRNQNGYEEYRATYLSLTAATITIGQGASSGSGRIKINGGSAVATTVNVFGTGTPAERGIESFLFLGTNAGNVLNVSQGSVGVAVFAGETANLSGGLKVGYETNQASDAQVRCGSGVTLATITQTGGELEVNSNATTVTRTAGTMTHRGASTITTLNNLGGVLIDESTGTYTTVNNYAEIDRRRVISAQTWTTTNVYPGSKTFIPSGTTAPAYGVVCTNAPNFYGCEPGDEVGTVFKVGLGKKWTFADI